jgi:hypothetical protein
MRNLRLIQRDNHHQEPNANTRDHAPGVQVFDILRGGLQGAAEDEDYAAGEDGQAPAEIVACGACEGGSEEGAAGEDGYYGAFLGFVGIEARFEVGGGDYAGDDAEVVAVEDGADGGEDGD